MNPWILVFVAGGLEIVWAMSLKMSDGFTRLWPSVITIVAASLSFWALAVALRYLPAGTAYAVWVGIGALGIAILGIIWYAEPATTMRIAGIALIVAGIVTLKLA
jgi:quaternary ammonium compound-resistance protein SugE